MRSVNDNVNSDRRGSGFFFPPPVGVHALACRSSLKAELQPRRGITLLEVLISIFVLAVGLCSVASLVPVAAFQVQKAQIDDRKALLGPSAARMARTIGMCRPDNWLYANGKRFCDPATGMLFGGSQNGVGTGQDIGNPQSLPCVAIDPCMSKKFGTQAPLFAAAGASAPQLVMPRMTCYYTLGAAADQICMSQDDLVFAAAASDPDALPTGGFNSIKTKRAFEGRFSWLATMVPVFGDPVAPRRQGLITGIPLNRNAMILSIVVFNQRPSAIVPGQSGSGEHAAAATFMPANGAPNPNSAIGIGAGELQISSANQENLAVKSGEWIMLGTMLKDPNAPGASPAQQVRPYFRWYRVVTAGPLLNPGDADNQTSTFARDLTLAGPDWNMLTVGLADSKNNPQFWAFIYDGAVAVYERTVHLEGPSMWSN